MHPKLRLTIFEETVFEDGRICAGVVEAVAAIRERFSIEWIVSHSDRLMPLENAGLRADTDDWWTNYKAITDGFAVDNNLHRLLATRAETMLLFDPAGSHPATNLRTYANWNDIAVDLLHQVPA